LLPPSPSALSARDPLAGEGPARVPMKCVGIGVHPRSPRRQRRRG
jgi:hypothetical protein